MEFFEEEKKIRAKNFYLSLELSTDLREANDDITKTTHYGEVAETVKKIFFQRNMINRNFSRGYSKRSVIVFSFNKRSKIRD